VPRLLAPPHNVLVITNPRVGVKEIAALTPSKRPKKVAGFRFPFWYIVQRSPLTT